MKRHKVTRKTKSGKTITYYRGSGGGSSASKVKGIKGKKKAPYKSHVDGNGKTLYVEHKTTSTKERNAIISAYEASKATGKLKSKKHLLLAKKMMVNQLHYFM